MRLLIFCIAGKKRLQTACMNSRFLALAVASTFAATSALGAMLFSQSTALPCSRQSRQSSGWRRLGVATYTTSKASSCARAS
eukprot:scaffold53_cov193-Pinguiococcus_pyrenoidosus.AAC.47